MTYDPSTDIGRVRLLCTDTNEDYFTDAEIEVFISEESNLKCAAALALETLASNAALVDKKIEILDLKIDGPAVATELRRIATGLRASSADAASFDIATVIWDKQSYVDHWVKELARYTS